MAPASEVVLGAQERLFGGVEAHQVSEFQSGLPVTSKDPPAPRHAPLKNDKRRLMPSERSGTRKNSPTPRRTIKTPMARVRVVFDISPEIGWERCRRQALLVDRFEAEKQKNGPTLKRGAGPQTVQDVPPA